MKNHNTNQLISK